MLLNPGEIARRSHSWLRRPAPVALTALLGVVATLCLFMVFRRIEHRELDAEFRAAAELRIEAVKRGLGDRLALAKAIVTLFNSSLIVDRDEFAVCTDELLRGAPEIREVAWAPRVPHEQRDSWESGLRRGEMESFRITRFNAWGQVVRMPTRDEYFPVHYVQPFTENEGMVGLDLAADSHRRKLLWTSCDEDRVLASGPVPLDSDTTGVLGFFAFAPVFAPDGLDSTVSGRREALRGFVAVVLRYDELMEQSLESFDPGAIVVELADASDPRLIRVVHARGRRDDSEDEPFSEIYEPTESPWSQEAAFETGGRRWLVRCQPSPAFLTKYRTGTPWLTLFVGLPFTGLVMLFVKAQFDRARVIENEVRLRTAELNAEIADRKRTEQDLRESNEQLQSLNGQLDAMAVQLKALMNEVVENNTLTARCPNPSLARCWEVKACQRADCPAYRREDNLRCWEINGALCGDGGASGSDARRDLCRTCGVYVRARRNSFHELGETFNEMVSVLQRRQAALEQARLDADAANRSKSEFLANMSHE
ncbi:MAG: hypothetical protein GX621_13370, partial [Pirellulaceae bacterium]|nr:hypothetical protein [Pirellulaceae bacterium]